VVRSNRRPSPSRLVRKVLATALTGLTLPHCFHRFAEHVPPGGADAPDDGGAGGESGESMGGASSGAPGAGTPGVAGGAGGRGGSSGSTGAGAGMSAGGSSATAGGGGSVAGTSPAGGAGNGSAGDSGATGVAGENAGAGGEGTTSKPQCAVGSSTPRVLFEDDFETYALGAPYGQAGSPWVRAVEGRVGVVSSEGAVSGAQSLELASFTTASEVAYAALALAGPPRRVVVELRYAPEGGTVFLDFAELGLARVPSKFDLRPTVALEVNDHVLELRAAPEKPIASSNGRGPYEPAVKPPFVVLFEEVDYASDASTVSYFRIDFDYCADTVSAYVGSDEDAPLVGTGSFDGGVAPDAFYLAGGLNTTFVDDVRVLADD
jgi:hypothetical protein